MNSLFLFVFTFGLLTTCCKSCFSNINGIFRFGPKCGFMCHCKNNEQCDVTSGECESGCASMWFGPGCQYRDIVEGEFSRQSDNLPRGKQKFSNLAHDGNINTCSYTADANSPDKRVKPFWRVWLPTKETVRELIIITRKEALGNFKSFAVYVENVDANKRDDNSFKPYYRTECYKHDHTAPYNETMIVLCKTLVAGNQVRIELATLHTQLVLCDVRINGGRNLAFGRQTSQSSIGINCARPNGCISNNAVDGIDLPSYWQECSYTLTENNPWWQVDIGHQAQIWYAQVSPYRRDISTLKLRVSNTTDGPLDTISEVQVNSSLNTVTQFVTITKPERSRLEICEVKVFGDCLEEICGYDCRQECHCRNMNMLDKISGTCSAGCKDRWTGRHCNLSCDDQHWGPLCGNKCGLCLNSDPCDVSTGHCPNGCQEGLPPKCSSIKQQPSDDLSVCPEGRYGPKCQKHCPRNCIDEARCNKETGYCERGCKPGYQGLTCVQECETGKYGHGCRQSCSNACLGGYHKCSHIDGTCTYGCNQGWNGTRCDQECETGTYGHGCRQSCSNACFGAYHKCSHIDGTCTDGCNPGWKGTRCGQECEPGKYGPGCRQSCSNACLGGYHKCSHVDGTCTDGCKPGWRGIRCDQECGNGRYGHSCRHSCSNTCLGGYHKCSHVDGTCTDGCNPGWKGTRCDQECENGKYGHGCRQSCSNACFGGYHKCSHVDGTCTDGCNPGWKGTRCDQDCENGTYGHGCRQNCSSTCLGGYRKCNHADGKCTDGCNSGWKGIRCDQACQDEYYGPNCAHRCSTNCYNRQCDKKTGHCQQSCKPGYQGQTCHQECENGKYGHGCKQTCSSACLGGYHKCSHVDGECTDGCNSGWKGTRCDQVCDNGKYGLRCSQTCPMNCKEGTVCNKENGQCDFGCRPGFFGDKCDNKCDDGKFGQNCSEACSSNCKNDTDCDKVNGTCYQGCKPGYKGEKCEHALHLTDSPGGLIIGITVALTIVFIISIATAVAIVYMRRKRRHRTKERSDIVELPVSRAEYVNSIATKSRQEHCSTNQKSGESTIYTNAVYADVSKQSKSAIPISALAEHFKTNGDQILDEFQTLPYGMQYPSTVGVKACNRGKNRYRDMYAYDHSRVVLDTLSGEEGSGYINACFIRGYLKEQAYIAAQGPVEATIDDFWRMVWEKDVTTIAMLTNLVEETKAKCLQYWPVVESSSNYGDFLVRTDSEIVFAEFTIREFHVSCGREPLRCIRQFHYTAWPDKSVPRSASSLLHFWRKVRKNDETKSHPWLVHCSAGVGRTGTFIATDILYDQAKAKDYVDIYQCVGDLREQRVNMVQTKGQYKFLYGLMTETFVVTPELVPLESFEKMVENLKELDSTTSKTKLFLEYKVLNQDSPYITSEDNNEDKYLAARLPINKDKNRCSDILPPNEFRPFLLTKLPNCSDYINAVYMPSYCETNCYILTQLPMKTTAIDCCRLVYEEDVKVIVTFDEKVKQEVGTYLPENGMIKLGPFTVLKKSEEDKNIYIKKMFIFSYGSEKREIIQLAFKAWTSSLLVPRNPHVMMKFIQEAEYYRRSYENKPVIVQCLNGSEKCGLYVAVVNVLERARFDNEVSIPQVIRELRVRREQIIPNFEQFKFCYDVLLCHIENDSMYANM